MVYKCKMCGGDIQLQNDKTIGTCEYCGCTMTLPKKDDEQKIATFNRGNQFRRLGEFDKATALYEHLIAEDDTNAEAHWCCALSRFGIEYVEDPTTLEYIPTCHRASYDNFLEDVDYQAALKYSEGITRKYYQKEGIRISEIQKDILKISQNEEAFDVFICYKESDEDGNRTIDSTLAQDIYYQLTETGLRVFFSRITLEDKVGTEYEPYIFSALNSAKVMIVIGTKADYLNAIWVKNEWSRFVKIIKADRTKVLIPCYRDMDPYDMPETLSVLQSYDMSKIGFMQDLIRGINKIIDRKQADYTQGGVANAVPRASGSAGNISSLIERAYMLLEDGEFEKANEIAETILNDNPKEPEGYVIKILAKEGVNSFDLLSRKAIDLNSDTNFLRAMKYANSELKSKLELTKKSCEESYKEKRKQKTRRNVAIGIAACLVGVICLYIFVLQYPIKYAMGEKKISKGQFEEAEDIFIYLDNYKNSSDMLSQTYYLHGINLMENGKYEEAKALLEQLGDYNDSLDLLKEVNYLLAIEYRDASHYQEAYDLFLELGDYKDSEERALNVVRDHNGILGVGGTIVLGSYKEPIEWTVLEVKEDRMLLMSKYAIEKMPYNKQYASTVWERCSLRKWLNSDFISQAFTDDEQEMILETKVTNSFNKYGAAGGMDTVDKLYLLSIDEANQLFENEEARKLSASDNTVGFWWLRDPGNGNQYAAIVSSDGYINVGGTGVNSDEAVRPVMWVAISKDK